MKSIRVFFLSLGLFVMCASLAGAHAFVDTTEPAVGSKVASSPDVVKIWFTRNIRSDASTMQVFDARGKEVDKRNVKRDSDDTSLLTVSVPKLADGTYKVMWTAVCIDGHTTHGSFTFDVGKP